MQRRNSMTTYRTLRFLPAIILLTMSGVGCGSDDPAVTAEPEAAASVATTPLATVAGAEGFGDALITGAIRIADGCVLLEEQVELVLLVWPAERTSWDGEIEAVSLTNLDGSEIRLRDGDRASFGGGGSSVNEGGLDNDAFIASVDWDDEPSPGCVRDTRWFVAEWVPIDG